MINIANILENAQKASYLVAQRHVKRKKLHTTEELILPSVVKLCEVMLEAEAASKLRTAPFSNDTVTRRTEELWDDLQSQLMDRFSSILYLNMQLCDSCFF